MPRFHGLELVRVDGLVLDLPVVEKVGRGAATDFRNGLLDHSFAMSQYSVYIRCYVGQAQVDTLCKKLENALSLGGTVSVLQAADNQYERIIPYYSQAKQPANKATDQFDLF